MKQTKFKGAYFCGMRGGLAFKDVTRVDAISKKCPKGTDPCSSKTSHANTVCYPKDQHNTNCPITEIKFVKKKSKVVAKGSKSKISPKPIVKKNGRKL